VKLKTLNWMPGFEVPFAKGAETVGSLVQIRPAANFIYKITRLERNAVQGERQILIFSIDVFLEGRPHHLNYIPCLYLA